MTVARASGKSAARRFRAKLFLAMVLIVSGLTASGLYLAEHNATVDVERDLQHDFRAELAALHSAEEVRSAALAERCRVLAEKPRIHAALEDNALDLLYPSARDELRDLMENDTSAEQSSRALHGIFYRFLDRTGAVLVPPNEADVGALRPEEEASLALRQLPSTPQTGYLARTGPAKGRIDEIIALPITSTTTGEVIAALVVGIKPLDFDEKRAGTGMKSGIWANGSLQMPGLSEVARAAIDQEVSHTLGDQDQGEKSYRVQLEGAPHLLFYKRLNPGSVFPPAYEVCVYPLDKSLARQRHLRRQILGTGLALLVAGFAASHLISARLSAPVAKLSVDSEENRAHRKRVEATLASTNEELERSSRFSADASHQLKTPVTVLRAGLEHLLARENFSDDVYDELSSLLHQTYRLTGVIDDLLLLSRMDAGHLRIQFHPVNLSQLINEWLDDLSALPDAPDVEVTSHLEPLLFVAGESRYISIIVQNLLENARKYNQPGGRIEVAARADDTQVLVTIGNSGAPIPLEMQPHIFERFARGSEKVSGHGLGLNLARELARLHGGDLRLVCSNDKWTEFEIRFRKAQNPATNLPAIA